MAQHPVVMKFGGTSVEDAPAMRNICRIVQERAQTPRLVVLSACAGATNTLIRVARKAVGGNLDDAMRELDALCERHLQIARELPGTGRESVEQTIRNQAGELGELLRSLAVLRVLPPQSLDRCAAYGEIWSSMLVGAAMLGAGMPAIVLDARNLMITDDTFTQAIPQFPEISVRLEEQVLPILLQGSIAVTQGFIGATGDGVTTTIGRGGSDYSAAIFGATLDAQEIQIWTDVDGVLSADPNVFPAARHVRVLSFNEAAELAYFGAKVLHPSTILPAIEKNIPVRVLNSRNPAFEGTIITRTAAPGTDGVVKSIACRKGITVITIQSTRMLMGHGFLARVFEVFSRHDKSVDVVVTSEVSISLTVDDPTSLAPIIRALEEFATVQVNHGKAILCVVGERLKYTKGLAGRIFNSLAEGNVNIEMISHGGSEINLTVVIDETEVPAAVRVLHEELFPPP